MKEAASTESKTIEDLMGSLHNLFKGPGLFGPKQGSLITHTSLC